MNDLDKYIISRWCYSIGQPIISDAEYNLLHSTMQELYPLNPYVNRSWSSDPCPKELLIANNMQKYIYDVLLTDKTESIPSLNTFTDLENELGNINYGTISYKHDGWNYQASYYNSRIILFQSRGRLRDAVPAEHMIQYVPNTIPMQGKVTVVMELTVPDEAFAFCKNKFGNTSQRSSVSTLLANQEYSKLLAMHAFNIISDQPVGNIFQTLSSWGYDTPMWTTVHSYDDILHALKGYSEFADKYGYPTDGLVYRGDVMRAIRLDYWEEPIYKSFVLLDKPYNEEHAAHRISVKCKIYPIKLKNNTQYELSLTNLKRILDLNLQPGYPVAFRIASSAIADVDEEATRLLQKKYEGKEDQYREYIIHEEEMKSYG